MRCLVLSAAHAPATTGSSGGACAHARVATTIYYGPIDDRRAGGRARQGGHLAAWHEVCQHLWTDRGLRSAPSRKRLLIGCCSYCYYFRFLFNQSILLKSFHQGKPGPSQVVQRITSFVTFLQTAHPTYHPSNTVK